MTAAGGYPKKRDASGGSRRHDRNKFRRVANHEKASDFRIGVNGILFTCAPHTEKRAIREGCLLLSKHCDELTDELAEAEQNKTDANNEDNSAIQSLDDELTSLRSNKGKPFTAMNVAAHGVIFVRVDPDIVTVSLETLVERALRDARATGSPNTKNCIRMLPIHNTCYASPEDVVRTALSVVTNHFPKLSPKNEENPNTAATTAIQSASYAIIYRSRSNSKADRDVFIKAIAEAIHDLDDRYTVNLTSPDVTLIVEIFRTDCFIGTFAHFYELAKMNLREAACPTKPKEQPSKTTEHTKTTAVDKTNQTAAESNDNVTPKNDDTDVKQNNAKTIDNSSSLNAVKEDSAKKPSDAENTDDTKHVTCSKNEVAKDETNPESGKPKAEETQNEGDLDQGQRPKEAGTVEDETDGKVEKAPEEPNVKVDSTAVTEGEDEAT